MGVHSLLADVTIPFDFGLGQLFVLVIGLIGLTLLIWALVELKRGKPDKDGIRRRRRFGYGRAVGGSALLLIAIGLLYLAILLQSYFGLQAEILVARVRATQLSNVPNFMSVELTLYDQHGNVTDHETDGVCGDRWLLQGDIVRFPDWMHILGLHTGYKVTRLEGQYSDPSKESTWYKTVVTLNGGDDNFFQTLQHQGGWLHPLVESAYGNAIILPADGNTYNVYVSQTGLTTRGPTSLGGHAPHEAMPVTRLTSGSGPSDCRPLH